MIVIDASGLLAAIDDWHPLHAQTRAVLAEDTGPFLLSPFVLAELDYLIQKRRGVADELRFLREVASGVYRLEPFDAEDIALAADLVERYSSLDIGLADASLVVLAARAATTRILSLDERHFRAIRPLRGRAFTLLPADA